MSHPINDFIMEDLAEEILAENPDISNEDLEKEVERRMSCLPEPDLKAIAEEEGQWD
jgi:hypothetical protein